MQTCGFLKRTPRSWLKTQYLLTSLLTLLLIRRILALVVLAVHLVQALLVYKLDGAELAGIIRLGLGQFIEDIVVPVDL